MIHSPSSIEIFILQLRIDRQNELILNATRTVAETEVPAVHIISTIMIIISLKEGTILGAGSWA